MCVKNHISPQVMVWAWKETSLRYTWLGFLGRQLSTTHSKNASMQTAWHCQPSTNIWSIFASLFTIWMHAFALDVWRVLGNVFTDSFHLQSSNLIQLYSIGSMVTNHVVCMSSYFQELELTLQLTSLKSSSLSWFTICLIFLTLFLCSTIATLPFAHNGDFTCYWIELGFRLCLAWKCRRYVRRVCLQEFGLCECVLAHHCPEVLLLLASAVQTGM